MNRYVCHVMDLYSRYSHVRSFPTKEAAPIAEWLLELYTSTGGWKVYVQHCDHIFIFFLLFFSVSLSLCVCFSLSLSFSLSLPLSS